MYDILAVDLRTQQSIHAQVPGSDVRDAMNVFLADYPATRILKVLLARL